MLINCDIGERGVAHAVDDQLMAAIDIANIACGGHAGNEQSVAYYYALAQQHGVRVSVHLSYPDRQNFGRERIEIDDKTLLKSLDQQYEYLSEVKTLKFHGALYNEANINKELAKLLMNWAKDVGIEAVLTPQGSAIARYCQADTQIVVIHEVFLDRQYIYTDNSLRLQSRKEPDALLTSTEEAVKQYQNFNRECLVIANKEYKIKADTGCIHSDSDNALQLLAAIKRV